MTLDWKTLFLSPRGRINRAKYWLGFFVSYAVFLVIYVPIIATIGPDRSDPTATEALLLVVIGLLSIAVTYIGIILGIKRFHDRDKSGWWVLIGLVPLIGGIWYLVECGCLRGTIGRNRFGPDPLAPNEDIVQVFDSSAQTPIR